MGQLTMDTELLIIGGGPGGYVAAIRAAQLGVEVVLVEKDNRLGGVCLNTGCIPTKAIIHASNFYSNLREVNEMGIYVEKYSINLEKTREWKNNIITKLGNGIMSLFKHHNIEIVEGVATFVSENEVHISGKSDVTKIRFKYCIIATGSIPIEIPGFKYDCFKILSSDDILDLKNIPKKILIIGGGYIGTEIGTVLSKFGVDVTIVEAQDRLIPQLDYELVKVVQDKLLRLNVKMEFNSRVVKYEEKDDSLNVFVEQKGVLKNIETEKILVVVGRKPNTFGLGLENAKIKLDDKGFIKVDSQMRTTNPNVFAIGDVVGQPMLAHKASRQGKIAAEVIAGKNSAFDNKVIPFVVFNDPEIASVGMTEEDAIKNNYDIVVGKFPFRALGRALTLNQTDGFVKIIADKKSHIVLGVHAVGPNVSDIISEATLAIEMSATLEDIAYTIHPHPTLPESIMEAAEVTLGSGIHIFTGKG